MRFKWFSGWWFQTFFMFHSIWDNPSHWLIFFKIVETTNQKTFLCSGSYFPSTWLIMEVSSNIRSWFYVRWGMDQNQHLFCFLMDIHSYFCTRIPENSDPNPTLNLGEHPKAHRSSSALARRISLCFTPRPANWAKVENTTKGRDFIKSSHLSEARKTNHPQYHDFYG